jgi:hypothetical protein
MNNNHKGNHALGGRVDGCGTGRKLKTNLCCPCRLSLAMQRLIDVERKRVHQLEGELKVLQMIVDVQGKSGAKTASN